MFQFQTGSIKSMVEFEDALKDDIGFNSKLVRLKVDLFYFAEFAQGVFQFQTGSIKRAELVQTQRSLLLFQFQTGSIKREATRREARRFF